MTLVDFDALIRGIEADRVIRLFGEEHRDIRELPYRMGMTLQHLPLLPPEEQDLVMRAALQHAFGAERLAAWEGQEAYSPAHATLLVAYLLSGFSGEAVAQTAARMMAKNAGRLTEMPADSISVSTGPSFSPTSAVNTASTCVDRANSSGESSCCC